MVPRGEGGSLFWGCRFCPVTAGLLVKFLQALGHVERLQLPASHDYTTEGMNR